MGLRGSSRGEWGERSEGCEAIVSIFEENSGDYAAKMLVTRDRFPAAAVEYPKSDSLLVGSTYQSALELRETPRLLNFKA